MRLNPTFVIFAFVFMGSPLFAQPMDDCEGANGSKITLDVHEPQYSSCGEVSINGYVGTEQGEITSIHWEWGDGSQGASWFPAVHSYASNGTYKVIVTAEANGDTCQQQEQQLSLNITNAADAICNQPEPVDFDVRVLKSVDNPVPSGSQQTVEFTVEVSNVGEGAATGVVVEDKLPPELAIPEGMAAFTSAGHYDPSSGRWELGDLGPGLPPEILTIPVVITTEPQPVCVLNTASSHMPGDKNPNNDSSYSALRRPGIARCVDLVVEVTSWYTASNACAGTGFISYHLRVSNAGPAEARNVVLDISETHYEAPGFTIDEATPHCDGLRCTWQVLYVGQNEPLVIRSEEFQVQAPSEHGIRAVVSSDIEDYKPDTNTLVEQHTIGPFREVSCEGGGMDFGGGVGGGGGGCFIATAIYGSASHPDVKKLREFRDNVLLKTNLGQGLIEFYYRHSPGLACYIEEHDSLKVLARGLLLPLVLAVAYPWQALVALFAAMGCLIFLWRRVKD